MNEATTPDGGPWVKLHRSFFSSDIWRDHNLSRVFLWCLGKANWRPRVWNGILIPRGSFATGKIAGANEVGLSSSAFFRALKSLEKRTLIVTKANRKFTVVSVRNYDLYQNKKLTRGPQADHKRTKPGPQADQTRTTSGHNEEVRSKIPELNRGATPATATEPRTEPTQAPPAPAAAPPIPSPPPAGRHVEDNPNWFNIACSTPWAPPDEPPLPEPRYIVEPFDGAIIPGGIIPAYDHHRLAMSHWLGEIDQNYFREVKALANHVVEPLPVPRSCDPGSVFQWLRPEHLLEGPKGALNVARWFRSQLAAEAPVFMAHQADLLFALCCHKQLGASGGHIRNRVGYFARLCTTQTKSGWTPMARHAKRLVVDTPKIYRLTIDERRPT